MSHSDVKLESHEEKVSYGFGLQFGQQLSQRNNFEGLSLEALYKGIADAYQGQQPALEEADLNEAYTKVQEKITAATEKQAEQMKGLGETYLAENRKREGVQVTESGIQYEVLTAAEGSKPTAEQTVRVHYHGTHIDGQVFDSSVKRGEPAEFGLNQVIPGWTEILQLMAVGSKWRVTIPHQLAYGEAGSPPVIPGCAVLVFEIELLDIL